MKRTVEDPNRSVRPPTCSSPMVISGCRPFQIIDATGCPDESMTVVRRRLQRKGGAEENFSEQEVQAENSFVCETMPLSAGTVTIEYTRAPDATSISAVFNMSAVVNLSSILL